MSSFPLPPADLAHIAAATEQLWDQARNRRFLITGGTGFVGLWLVESLLHINAVHSLGLQVVVPTRDPDAFRRKAPHLVGLPALAVMPCDLRRDPSPRGPFDFVVHAANDSYPPRRDRAAAELLDETVSVARRLLDAAVAAGTRRFLFVSSGAIYGPLPAGAPPVREDQPFTPLPLDHASVYSLGKRAVEELGIARTAGTDTAFQIARCFALIGPRLPLDGPFAAGNFLRDALRGETIRIQGDGSAIRSYLYAADLAVWLWHVLLRGRANRPYHVGSDEEVSIGELAARIAGHAARPGEVIRSQAPIAGAQPARYVPAIDRITRELELPAPIPLDAALKKTIAWLRTHPQ